MSLFGICFNWYIFIGMSAQSCCALIIIHIETQNKDDCCESIGDFLGKFYVFTQSLTL